MLVKLPKQEIIQRENNDHEYVAPRNEVEERIGDLERGSWNREKLAYMIHSFL